LVKTSKLNTTNPELVLFDVHSPFLKLFVLLLFSGFAGGHFVSFQFPGFTAFGANYTHKFSEKFNFMAGVNILL
jgi:hypothetical protein